MSSSVVLSEREVRQVSGWFADKGNLLLSEQQAAARLRLRAHEAVVTFQTAHVYYTDTS